MIKKGMAWHYKNYSNDPLYTQLGINARKNKMGLWHDLHPIAPWEWRKPRSGKIDDSNLKG